MMESHTMVCFHSIPCLLFLIFSTSLTFCAASSSWAAPRLSVHPPKWLLQRGGDESPNTPNGYLDEYTVYTYEQTLDHFTFRPESYTKFKQRFAFNPKYWGGANSNSPIFVYLGAEESLDDELRAVGLLYENAPKFKAMVLFIEHRFYGESFPYRWSYEKAIKHEEIRGCLSTSQVLADYAEIISYVKLIHSADLSPVVVFGGSYGGVLATWFRLKYPHIAMGALASSAPVLLHVGSRYTFFDRVAKDYWDTSKNCYLTIKQGLKEIARVASLPNGLAKLSKRYDLCRTAKNATEIQQIFKGRFTTAAQYDSPPNYPAEAVCKAIDTAPKSDYILDKLDAGFIATISPSANANGDDCIDLDQKEQGDIISYAWESCMELTETKQGVSNDSLFPAEPFSVVGYAEDCARQYGVPSRAPYWLVQNYGGKHIKLDLRRFGSNILFVNGKRDPWAPSGVLESISDTIVALIHPGAHCVDVQFSAKTDPQWLKDARTKEMSIIQGWLTTYYADLHALNMA